MKLSKREKVLLLGALIIIVFAVFITYVYLPLTKKVDKLQMQSDNCTVQLQEAQTREVLIENLEVQLKTIREELKTKHEDIIKLWDQAELLVLIETTIDEFCEKESIDFFDPIEAGSVQAGDISIKINTNYENLQMIMDKLETSKYFNILTSFEITKVESSNYDNDATDTDATDNDTTDNNNDVVFNPSQVNNEQKELDVILNIRFFSRNINEDYPKEYDFLNGEFGKENIFN